MSCRFRLWVFIAFLIIEMVLERDMLGLLCGWLIDDGVGLFDEADVSDLFDLGLDKKLVLLIVHYFIDYSNLTHQSPSLCGHSA